MRNPSCFSVALLIVLASCNGDSKPIATPSPCATPTPVAGIDRLPADLGLDEFGTLVRLQKQKQTVNGDIQTTVSVIELYPKLAHAVLDAGFDIRFSENEGFEGEIFFVGSKHRFGAYRLREGPCPHLVTIRFFYGQRKTKIPGLHDHSQK